MLSEVQRLREENAALRRDAREHAEARRREDWEQGERRERRDALERRPREAWEAEAKGAVVVGGAEGPHATGPVEKKVRLVFIRHGESMWNYAFNRGFKPSFLWRWLETTLYELYLLPLEDSAYAAQLVGAQFGGAQFGAIRRRAIRRNSAAQFGGAISRHL